jgi:hypothetical protein
MNESANGNTNIKNEAVSSNDRVSLIGKKN